MCDHKINNLFLYCLTFAGLLTLIGCNPINSGSTFKTLPGVLTYHDQPLQVTLPDTVPVNTQFAATVITYGTGCIAQGSTEIIINDLDAELKPYDWYVGEIPPDWICTDAVRMYEHTVLLKFTRTGTANITFTGRSLPDDQPMTVSYPVTIY